MAIVVRKPTKSDQAKMLIRRTRSQLVRVKSGSKPYLPSIGNVATSMVGGAIAGAIESGVTPIPKAIANIPTPLIFGGLLAGYGIYAGGKQSNPMIAKTASNLGAAMLACWTCEFVQEQLEEKSTPQEIGA
jgi:hypothetical protein